MGNIILIVITLLTFTWNEGVRVVDEEREGLVQFPNVIQADRAERYSYWIFNCYGTLGKLGEYKQNNFLLEYAISKAEVKREMNFEQ